MTKRALIGASLLVLLPLLGACGGGSSSAGSAKPVACAYPSADSRPAATPPPSTPAVSGTVHATVRTTIGTMRFTLDAAHAPCTVNSFVSLARQGYFDDTPCPRLTTSSRPPFRLLQCGDPTGSGRGGPGYTIPDEITGHEKYAVGTLAMANESRANTGGSQFFIVYGRTHLKAQYTVFGKADAGTVREIARAAKAGVIPQVGTADTDGTPRTRITIRSARLS